MSEERLEQLAGQGLEQARRASSPALEAEAYRFAAWCWQRDLAREWSYIEAGLEAAEAAKDLAIRSRLLERQATWLLKVGKPREAEGPAQAAAELYDRLGHRQRALHLRQHVLVLIEWELSRPGKATALLHVNFAELCDLGLGSTAALTALLLAELYCDVGDTVAARRFLEESHRLLQPGDASRRLNDNLVEGRILQLEGDTEGALKKYRQARAWGIEERFPDFVYQPGALAVRLLLQRADASRDDLAQADALLQELLEDQTMDRKHRERYEGELCALYARVHLARGNLTQAEVWLTRGEEWFTQHPDHRCAAECKATRLVFDWLSADRLEQSAREVSAGGKAAGKGRDEAAAALRKAQGIKTGVRKRVESTVRKVVEEMARTFEDARHVEGFSFHHPSRALLQQYGLWPGEQAKEP
jgi:hypothetical protein